MTVTCSVYKLAVFAASIAAGPPPKTTTWIEGTLLPSRDITYEGGGAYGYCRNTKSHDCFWDAHSVDYVQ